MIDWYKAKGKTEPLIYDFADKDDEPVKSTEAEKKAMKILCQLKRRYREVLEYRFLLNFTVSETAEVMGLNVNNVKVLQHRALQKAREL